MFCGNWWFENGWSLQNMKIKIIPTPILLPVYRNFAFSCDLTHVQKCAIQALARDISGSRSGLSCLIIAIELLQARYYAVMKGVFSFSFQLANLGKIPYVISPWHRFWGKEFSKVLKCMWSLFPWKKMKEIYFCPTEPQSFTNVCNGYRSLKILFQSQCTFWRMTCEDGVWPYGDLWKQ